MLWDFGGPWIISASPLFINMEDELHCKAKMASRKKHYLSFLMCNS